jgi:type IV pilus assembly protein PilV
MKRQKGFTLIEALVALAILSFGLMGVAAMQLNALHSATRSYQHSVATLAAVDAQERLWEALADADNCTPDKLNRTDIESDWEKHWKKEHPSNPLRSAKLDLQLADDSSDDCVYEITVKLDDEEADDEGYGNVNYTMRLPTRKGAP